MSTDRDFTTRIVRSWLHEDAHEDADRILNLVLDEIDTTPQRRANWLARRFPAMNNNFVRVALVAAVLVVAVVIGANLLQPPSVGPSPSVEPSPTSSVQFALPLVNTFTSPRNGYSLKYPASWTVKPATESWGPGLPANWGTSVRDELATSSEFWLIGASQALAPGQSAATWIEAYAGWQFDCQGPVPLTAQSVGGESGFIVGTGCGWRQLEGPGGSFSNAVVVVGGRAYMFQISGISNAPAGQATQALVTNFKAILSSVAFQPADAIDP